MRRRSLRHATSKEKPIKKASACNRRILNVTNASARAASRINPFHRTRIALRLTATSSCLRQTISSRAVFRCTIKTAVVRMTGDVQRQTTRSSRAISNWNAIRRVQSVNSASCCWSSVTHCRETRAVARNVLATLHRSSIVSLQAAEFRD